MGSKKLIGESEPADAGAGPRTRASLAGEPWPVSEPASVSGDVMASEGVLVIGVGNPYRRDDGFGIAVLNRLVEMSVPGVRTVEESGESAALISRWSGYEFVIMVDAVSSGAQPGTVHRLEYGQGKWNVAARSAQASTHGLGVADAVELGKVLDQLPQRLVILGVETADVSSGVGLSYDVAAAVDVVVSRVVAEASAGQSTPGQAWTPTQARTDVQVQPALGRP